MYQVRREEIRSILALGIAEGREQAAKVALSLYGEEDLRDMQLAGNQIAIAIRSLEV